MSVILKRSSLHNDIGFHLRKKKKKKAKVKIKKRNASRKREGEIWKKKRRRRQKGQRHGEKWRGDCGIGNVDGVIFRRLPTHGTRDMADPSGLGSQVRFRGNPEQRRRFGRLRHHPRSPHPPFSPRYHHHRQGLIFLLFIFIAFHSFVSP